MADGDTVQEVKVPAGTEPAKVEPIDIRAEIAKAVAAETDKISRRFQSEKDKAISEARRQVGEAQRATQLAQETATQLEGLAMQSDPQAAELAKLRTQSKFHSTRETDDQRQREAEAFAKAFHDEMVEMVTDLGVDPTDTRIEWGADNDNAFDRHKKIRASAKQIIKEGKATVDKQTVDKDEMKKMEDRIRAELRKEMGLDSHDTDTPKATAKASTLAELREKTKDVSKMSAKERKEHIAALDKAMK